MRGMGNRDLCLVWNVTLRWILLLWNMEQGWTDAIDQAHWSFLDPRTYLPVGLLKLQVRKWSRWCHNGCPLHRWLKCGSSTFCTSTDTWLTGLTLQLPEGLCACSTL